MRVTVVDAVVTKAPLTWTRGNANVTHVHLLEPGRRHWAAR